MRHLRHAAPPPARLSRRAVHGAFVGYGSEDEEAVLELTHNWDAERYEIGSGFGHVPLSVDDIHRRCEELRQGASRGRVDFAGREVEVGFVLGDGRAEASF